MFPSFTRVLRVLAICVLFNGLASTARAQAVAVSDDGVTTFFGLTTGDNIIGYEFLTEDGNTIIERQNGVCIRKINVPDATVAILSPYGPLLGFGTATLNVQATVDCDTLAYNDKRVMVSSVGNVVDLAGNVYRMTVYAVIINGTVKISNTSFDPV